jgi:hypothetical protein
MDFNEKRAACHPDTAPTVSVLPVRTRSGVWNLSILRCPYCNGQHLHGGGNGDRPEVGHRVAHCTVGALGYVLAEVQP